MPGAARTQSRARQVHPEAACFPPAPFLELEGREQSRPPQGRRAAKIARAFRDPLYHIACCDEFDRRNPNLFKLQAKTGWRGGISRAYRGIGPRLASRDRIGRSTWRNGRLRPASTTPEPFSISRAEAIAPARYSVVEAGRRGWSRRRRRNARDRRSPAAGTSISSRFRRRAECMAILARASLDSKRFPPARRRTLCACRRSSRNSMAFRLWSSRLLQPSRCFWIRLVSPPGAAGRTHPSQWRSGLRRFAPVDSRLEFVKRAFGAGTPRGRSGGRIRRIETSSGMNPEAISQ